MPDDREPASFASYDEAVRWFDVERANLAAAVRQAAEHGIEEVAWQLAVALRAIYMRFNTFDDWIATSETGLQAASALGELAATAELLESLGMAHTQAHDLELGTSYHHRALEIRRQPSASAGTKAARATPCDCSAWPAADRATWKALARQPSRPYRSPKRTTTPCGRDTGSWNSAPPNTSAET
jgi:hypothetical protein